MRARLRHTRAWVVAHLAVLTLQTVTAAAPTTTGFALNRYRPSEAGSDWFELDSLDLRGNVRPALGLIADFGYRPLILREEGGDSAAAIVDYQFFYHVSASLVLGRRLRLAASLPLLVFSQGGSGILEEAAGVADVPLSSEDGSGLGDARFSADVRLVGQYSEPFSLALGTRVFAAVGQEDQFTSDGRARLEGRLAFAGQPGIFSYAGHVGVLWHSERDDYAALPFGTDLTFGVAAGLRLLDGRITVGPEVYGSTVISDSGDGFLERATTPLEFLLGGKMHAAESLRLGAAGGGGLSQGLGSPVFRVVASLEWSAPLDKRVAVVPAPEPARDLDGDGVEDEWDACPNDAGPARPLDRARSGCPDPADDDGDGIGNDVDACPAKVGAPSADRALHGCPPPDTDGDGIVDAVDACMRERGVQQLDARRNGCPSDADGDGILDIHDGCPGAAGSAHADPKRHGCPQAHVEQGEIKIREQVKFGLGSAEILAESDGLLQAVATLLRDRPDIQLVSVEGHTDRSGPSALNVALSRRRAAAVVAWLVSHGIEAERLRSAGFGPERPLDDNATEEGRRNNRRVEFRIVRGPLVRPGAGTQDAAGGRP